MRAKPVIMFPYSGYEVESKRERLFWELVAYSRQVTGEKQPVIIMNRDTEISGKADAFLKDSRSKEADVQKVWAVDTCQMWLAGWGYVIDNHDNDVSRIILLPGDIDSIGNDLQFFHNLETFLSIGDPWDIVIGDFTSPHRFGAKDLIDQYGTYALLANWFPSLSRGIFNLPLQKPRSEFTNIKVEVLKELLSKRKFAYEQTLNMLIHSWDFETRNWKYRIKTHQLGTFQDVRSFRDFEGCLDQIERTERMLKLLWREFNKPIDESGYQDFVDSYARLDRISTAVRENARTTIRNLLGVAA
jgi:hypothetical protein